MDQLRIPSALAATSERAARHGDLTGLRAWVHHLPDTVASLAERWDLRLGDPYEPGGVCSWVAPARSAAGADLVLKVGWRHDEAVHESDALRLWAGDGAIQLHRSEMFDSTSALLLERCLPGDTLASVLAEPEQDVVVAGLLRRLWRQPPGAHPFRTLAAMCDAWADEFELKAVRSAVAVDPALAREGMALFRELPRSAAENLVLCTDLHAQNILASRREPWLVIDPKPYVGDPVYDPLQHLLNCEERLTADPEGLCARMADLLDLDRDRLRRWLFARCVQEGLDRPVLLDIAARLAP